MIHSISLLFISSLPQSSFHSFSSPIVLTDSFLPCRNYAAVVFFANSRFETGKRKLQYLSFQDFAFCAGQLISYWTVGAVGTMQSNASNTELMFFFLSLVQLDPKVFAFTGQISITILHVIQFITNHYISCKLEDLSKLDNFLKFYMKRILAKVCKCFFFQTKYRFCCQSNITQKVLL